MKFLISNFKFLILGLLFLIVATVLAHQVGFQNIDTRDVGERWAWNDVIGWIDFHHSAIHNIEVGSNEIRGWASSTVGYIVLNCATTPNGNICGSSNFKVNNDGGGLLSGFAWSENIGWISFCGNSTSVSSWNGSGWVCPAFPSYRVRIDQDGPSESHFKDWAWNDIVGWISFDCFNTGSCLSSNYRIQTSANSGSISAVLESNIFDTKSSKTYFNTIIWHGVQPPGTAVLIELATSNSTTTPWTYNAPINLLVSTPTKLIGDNYLDRRYIRYRVTLLSDLAQTSSPEINDIIINWSPL